MWGYARRLRGVSADLLSGSAALPYLLIGVVYVALRLIAFLHAGIRLWPDSYSYIHVSKQSLFSSSFYTAIRTWAVPLLYKLPGNGARAAGQLVVSIVCWTALAAAVTRCMRRLRPLAFALVLLFSLSVWITQWDNILLSESLACSLAALALAAWLELARDPRRWKVAAVLVVMLALAFTRPSEAPLALFAAPFALGWALWPRRRWLPAVLAVGLVAVFAATEVDTSGLQARWLQWEQSLLDGIGTRVLTNGDELRFFRAHGMPLPPEVAKAKGQLLGLILERDAFRKPLPQDAAFLDWVVANGRETLSEYLLQHPGYLARGMAHDASSLLDPRVLSFYAAAGTEPLFPAWLANVLYPPSVVAVLTWLGVVVLLGAVLVRRRLADGRWVLVGVALLIQLPEAAVIWGGDDPEVARHALLVEMLTRLTLLILSVFVLEVLLTRGSAAIRARSGSPPPAA